MSEEEPLTSGQGIWKLSAVFIVGFFVGWAFALWFEHLWIFK